MGLISNSARRSGFSEDAAEVVLRGRLGAELARLYGETLSAPLPSALSALVDRLANALSDHDADGSRADAR